MSSATVCIHQPDFAPYLGFFHRLLIADQFVVLDDVQFIRRGWQHRDMIKGKAGKVWLTLSIRKGDYRQEIRGVCLAPDSDWREANLNQIRECYSKAACFDEVYPQVKAVYDTGYERLIDFNMAMMDLAFGYLEISIPRVFASEYQIDASRTQRLVDLVKAVGGTNYLTGSGSRDYLEEELFHRAGITVEWQDFRHPMYPQQFGAFAPMLSCLDLLFNCGRDSASILRGCLSMERSVVVHG